jgi:hypothetical protein
MWAASGMGGYFRARAIVCIEDRRAGGRESSDALLAWHLPLPKTFILAVCLVSIMGVVFSHVDKSGVKRPAQTVCY